MTRPTTITLGSRLEDSITFKVDGVATDPGSITLRYRRFNDPGSEVVVSVPDPQNPPDPIERVGVGEYRALIDLGEAGDWRVRWEGTAPAKAASELRVVVETIYPA